MTNKSRTIFRIVRLFVVVEMHEHAGDFKEW
jgi:hypothetical protein